MMAIAYPKTVVQVLNSSLVVVAEILQFHPLNRSGMILRYSKELSDWGFCTFRISTKDPIFSQYGDILIPHQYHIRIKRGDALVWSGAIIDNTERNKLYVEVRCAEYEYYLSKALVIPDTDDPDISPTYAVHKVFKSGTMSAAISSTITDVAKSLGTTNILGGITIGTVENPNYPPGFIDQDGATLTGPWSFSDYLTLQYDIGTTAYQVLKDFGVYTKCDFEVDETLSFNFKKFLGSKTNNVTFRYGTQGNIVDYSLPRRGENMANNIIGIATDTNGIVLHVEQTDSASIATYGQLQYVQAYTNVKDQGLLKSSINAQLLLTKDPDVSAASVVLDEKGYPLGQYDVGDLVTLQVRDHVINLEQTMRVVGLTVNLHGTGREMTTVQMNIPAQEDI